MTDVDVKRIAFSVPERLFKETSKCPLIKGIAGYMPLKHGETCDRKTPLRLTNECFPRGLSKTVTVIPTFANAKILCRFK
jgi:hypothetical protein